MKLYYFAASVNCRRSLAVLNHLKADVELVTVDLTKGEHRTPEYLAINPNGKVPALVDGNVKIWESNAINAYVAEKVGNTTVWPRDLVKRAEVHQWMCWQMAQWAPACDTIQWENVGKPFFNMGPPDADRLKDGEERFNRFAAVLDAQLQGKAFVTGNEVTLADFAIAANLTYAVPAKMPVTGYRNIMGWTERMNGIEAWKKTAPF